MTHPEAAAAAPTGMRSASACAGGAPRRVQSADLFGAGRELVILHNDREYRLRLTQNGKLILTA